jgi:hypothetical protein
MRPPHVQQPIPLIVQNHHLLDVTVYALRSDAWLRLGTVTSCVTDTLQIPLSASLIGAVRLALDPVGSRERFPLGPIIVLTGDRIELTIEAYLPASTWRVLSRPVADVDGADAHALHGHASADATPVRESGQIMGPAHSCSGCPLCNHSSGMGMHQTAPHCPHTLRDSTTSGVRGHGARAHGTPTGCPRMQAASGASTKEPMCRL